jgi:Putative peptidoglycan binding domain
MPRPYQGLGAPLSQGDGNVIAVKALQHDLRALGYLHNGIDGTFGGGTAAAVRALTWDLLHNHGASTQDDGLAPVAIASFNLGRVTAVTASVDRNLADCVADLFGAATVPKLPSTDDAIAANRAAMTALRGMVGTLAPPPFLAAMALQESSGLHFRVPTRTDADNFVMVGLDRNNKAVPDAITSRGYGLGQYTIFHHPPRANEIQDFILDPVRNLGKAFGELREKYDKWIDGPIDVADDRVSEHPELEDLRPCRYAPDDERFMRDCRNCAAETQKLEIERGTPFYEGASSSYQPSQYYNSAVYHGVPNRAEFPCDWPYAARRYNGSGNDSFHYQTRILLNLLKGPL